MDTDFAPYKDLFVETGKEYLKSLNEALLRLEKDSHDKDAIASIFQNAHSLKGQSAAMGYQATGYLCHAVEDVFFEIKEGRLELTPELADLLFKAFDSLTSSLAQIEDKGTEVDLTPQAEALKQLTGVTTVGAEKSERGQKPAVHPQPAPAQEEPLEPTEAPVEKIKTIPVRVERLDEMLSLIEEIIVYRLVLKRMVRELQNQELENYMDGTGKIIEAMQFLLMKVRAVPVKMVFDHYPRAVRDLAREENKQVELVVEGEELELDRTIVERLDEPLTHLIRNAVSHGIKEKGTIRLTARHEKDYAAVEVADNGPGIDWQALAMKAGVETDNPAELRKLLFSGISTSEAVTQVSGRGVGLQVVKKNIEEFGGSLSVESKAGQGTSFTIRLPLTLAVMKALLVKVGGETYAVTTNTIDRTVRLPADQVQKSGGQEVFVLEGKEVPLIRLDSKLHPNGTAQTDGLQGLLVIIAKVNDEPVGLVVDGIIEATEVIMKPVPPILKQNAAFAGTTILGNGKSALILNPQGLV
jgi:two-component system chemotaxis sensor kinase CheA